MPSPPWGRGSRRGVFISRGEKGAPRSACRGGEGVKSRGARDTCSFVPPELPHPTSSVGHPLPQGGEGNSSSKCPLAAKILDRLRSAAVLKLTLIGRNPWVDAPRPAFGTPLPPGREKGWGEWVGLVTQGLCRRITPALRADL